MQDKIFKDRNFFGEEKADICPKGCNFFSIKNPRDLFFALKKIWCSETCAPRMREKWTPQNPALGQCSITAFLAQDIFGGRVFGIPREGGKHFHCYNVVEKNGNVVTFDLTSSQFGKEAKTLVYENNPEQFREVHFASQEKLLRYEKLRAKLLEILKNENCNFYPMRRKNQKLPQEKTEQIFFECMHGVLCLFDGAPYGVPLSFAFEKDFFCKDEFSIYFHAAKEGRKIDAIKKCERAAFCAISRDEIIPQKFTTAYESAIAEGSVEFVENDNERIFAMRALKKKYSPNESEENFLKEMEKSKNTLCVFKLKVKSLSGKQGLELAKSAH